MSGPSGSVPDYTAIADRLRPARIRTLCAWCGVLIHDGPMSPAGEESHGICGVCSRRYFGEDAP